MTDEEILARAAKIEKARRDERHASYMKAQQEREAADKAFVEKLAITWDQYLEVRDRVSDQYIEDNQ